MTKEEKEIRNKADKIIKKLIPSPKSDEEEFYVSCIKIACVEMAEQLQQENNHFKQQIEKMINEIDKTMVISNMREREIYDIQEIFRKYNFRRDDNDKWELKE